MSQHEFELTKPISSSTNSYRTNYNDQIPPVSNALQIISYRDDAKRSRASRIDLNSALITIQYRCRPVDARIPICSRTRCAPVVAN